ncbi:MAG: electron-transfer flavoprotein:ubiquinone oxidoreductase [Sedimentisphaerales bacterium]|jgi:electron-transferring-flavoprotein dehydrogenase|nr:electron-transfer flavoprotein:ubiquinone oxidoreductase [Sedimentisphaerales bacterium]
MPDLTAFDHVEVLIVGAGPAGLAAAIRLKCLRPDLEVCVIEKAAGLGQHNLSGAVLEPGPLFSLLDEAAPGWQDSPAGAQLLARPVRKDQILWLPNRKRALEVQWALQVAKGLGLCLGQMIHLGDYTISISELTRYLGHVATSLGVEVMTGFAARQIVYDDRNGLVIGVGLVDQGLDKGVRPQQNYLEGQTVGLKMCLLAEGCDGLLTEQLVQQAGLRRISCQLFSIGVKELVKVSPQQYEGFGPDRVVHALGYPLWRPVIGPGMFGGGIIYPGPAGHIAVGMIVGLDWKYKDFNPQDALTLFKGHPFVHQFINGGQVVEAGAKMIPEGGLLAIPRDPASGAIGKGNCMILGDSAGFVNMLKIKGLHNAVLSGMAAAQAVADCLEEPSRAAVRYTELIHRSPVYKEMWSARRFRHTIARLGPLIGMPLSVLDGLLPAWVVEEDYKATTTAAYPLRPGRPFDKDSFVAMAGSSHREDQPCHLLIQDPSICKEICQPRLNGPCVTFCPAGVYEQIDGLVRPANPSNCLHCKTCQRKCPFNNIRWVTPEGGGGVRYKRM